MTAAQYYATGRRKTSTARVFLRPGSGAIKINHREFEAFFPREALRMQIRTPLVLTETTDKFDILVKRDHSGRRLPIRIVRRDSKLFAIGGRRAAHCDIPAIWRFFRESESNADVIGNRCAVWSVMNINGDIRVGRNQFRRVVWPEIRWWSAGFIALFNQ